MRGSGSPTEGVPIHMIRPAIPPVPIPPPPPKIPTYHGTVSPKYLLLNCVYAAPGASPGGTDSKVSYTTQSSTGQSTSLSESFKAGVNVNASVSAGLGFGVEFSASASETETSSVEITKTESYQLIVNGPPTDGIDHGYDQYWLLLNPEFAVTMVENDITWSPGYSGSGGVVQYVNGDWLSDPGSMPASVLNALDAAKLTTEDYAQILACNPLRTGTLNSDRFVLITGLPYEPANQPGQAPDSQVFTLTNSMKVSDSAQVQVQYQVSCTISAGLDTPLTAKLSETGTLQFTVTAAVADSVTSTQTASLTLGGPSFSYGGPIQVLVYWDVVFGCFAFVFPTGNPTVSGQVSASAGGAAAYQPISLTMAGTTYTTVTDSKGVYRFYQIPAGTGSVTVEGHSESVTVPADHPQAVQPAPIVL
jgi:hypothetical protein